jgi:hypothetical protein
VLNDAGTLREVDISCLSCLPALTSAHACSPALRTCD